MEIDFKLLLEKYIQHVKESEGVDFINSGGSCSDVKFTPEENDILYSLSIKVEDRHKFS